MVWTNYLKPMLPPLLLGKISIDPTKQNKVAKNPINYATEPRQPTQFK